MSIFSRIKEYFLPKVIFVGKSVLSHPGLYHLELKHTHISVLYIIAEWGKLKASAIDRVYNSGGRRANDLLHLGYVDNIGTKKTFIYQINDKGLSLIETMKRKKLETVLEEQKHGIAIYANGRWDQFLFFNN